VVNYFCVITFLGNKNYLIFYFNHLPGRKVNFVCTLERSKIKNPQYFSETSDSPPLPHQKEKNIKRKNRVFFTKNWFLTKGIL